MLFREKARRTLAILDVKKKREDDRTAVEKEVGEMERARIALEKEKMELERKKIEIEKRKLKEMEEISPPKRKRSDIFNDLNLSCTSSESDEFEDVYQ